jgi:hypothetical protein
MAPRVTLPRHSNCVLMMTVHADIRTVANASGSRITCDARTPATGGNGGGGEVEET